MVISKVPGDVIKACPSSHDSNQEPEKLPPGLFSLGYHERASEIIYRVICLDTSVVIYEFKRRVLSSALFI